MSYYDRHTQCLKYGKVEWRDTIGNDNNDRLSNITAANSKAVVVDGVDSVNTGGDVGQFSDIKVIDNGNTTPTPIIVYYDRNNKCLKFAEGTEEKVNHSVSWSITKINNPSSGIDFGRYVAMEMDDNNGLHVVAQDVTKGILYYGYFEDGVAANPTGGWKKVDATGSVGRWNDIKLENPKGESILACKPVITSMDSSKLNTTSAIKLARYIDDTNGFESETVPSLYESTDKKLSVVVNAAETGKVENINSSSPVENAGIVNKYAVGYTSTMYAVDFLRGEK